MKLYTVWSIKSYKNKEEAKRKHLGNSIEEKCLIREDGNYIGVKTGKIYPKETHYHSENLEGIIIAVDSENKTGMYHLNAGWTEDTDENRASYKKKYLGCHVTLQKAHLYNSLQIYRCIELDEYFSENEVKIIKKHKRTNQKDKPKK